MAAGETGRPNLSMRAQDLAAEPEAMHWAQFCAWVPGTGYCRNHDCSDACLFHEQREADVRSVQRWRRLRRFLGRR
jgi:hypothetical protein